MKQHSKNTRGKVSKILVVHLRNTVGTADLDVSKICCVLCSHIVSAPRLFYANSLLIPFTFCLDHMAFSIKGRENCLGKGHRTSFFDFSTNHGIVWLAVNTKHAQTAHRDGCTARNPVIYGSLGIKAFRSTLPFK